MKLNKGHLDIFAKYFSDVSKILFGSTVVGFFVPIQGSGTITLFVFIGGLAGAIVFIIFSLALKR